MTTAAPPEYYLDVLYYYSTRSTDVATVKELKAFVSDRDRAPDAEREIAIRLHHATLPKLAAVGLLDYDPRTHTVRYRVDEAVESWVSKVVTPAGAVE